MMSKKKMRVLKKPDEPLNRNEWYFDDCPKDQTYLCWSYEFARNSSWICSYYKNSVENKSDAYVHGYYVDLSCYDIECPIWLPPGFPSKPFLTLDEDLRKEPLFDNLDYGFQINNLNFDSRAAFLAKSVQALSHPNCYRIFIHWDRSLKEIKKELSKLIDEIKPMEPSFRSKAGRPKDLITDLHALAIYRLDIHHKGFENAQRSYRKLKNKPPTDAASVWSRWKRKATEIISNHFYPKP